MVEDSLYDLKNAIDANIKLLKNLKINTKPIRPNEIVQNTSGMQFQPNPAPCGRVIFYMRSTNIQTVCCILAVGGSGRCSFRCYTWWRWWSSYRNPSSYADYQRRRIYYVQSCAGGWCGRVCRQRPVHQSWTIYARP